MWTSENPHPYLWHPFPYGQMMERDSGASPRPASSRLTSGIQSVPESLSKRVYSRAGRPRRVRPLGPSDYPLASLGPLCVRRLPLIEPACDAVASQRRNVQLKFDILSSLNLHPHTQSAQCSKHSPRSHFSILSILSIPPKASTHSTRLTTKQESQADFML